MRNVTISLELKEQHHVTAHVPNFDFLTGCREFKRCEEGKRTLKNPFASRSAKFDTTIKLFRITDQWYIIPIKFRFGRNWDFMALLSLPLAGGPREGKWQLKAYFSCQLTIHAQIILKGIRRYGTATKKTMQERNHWDMMMILRRSCGIKLLEIQCFATTF